MRDLLPGFDDQGDTLLLSSRLLPEIEVIADDLVVIGNGRIVARGTMSDLHTSAAPVVRAKDASASTPTPHPTRSGRSRSPPPSGRR